MLHKLLLNYKPKGKEWLQVLLKICKKTLSPLAFLLEKLVAGYFLSIDLSINQLIFATVIHTKMSIK